MYKKLKRGLDLFFSICLLMFLWLPMLLIWAWIRLDTPGRGIFRQIRVGRGGKMFVCYKFRTMYTSAPPCAPSSEFAKMEKYITPSGRFLRRTSLDELPQLFNVIKGDMSLVGPRPLILSESQVHRARAERGVYDIRPGLTGLSQVSGRDGVSDELKVALDTEYLGNLSFLQDVKIIARTFGNAARVKNR